jgi:hypothetical protein
LVQKISRTRTMTYNGHCPELKSIARGISVSKV